MRLLMVMAVLALCSTFARAQAPDFKVTGVVKQLDIKAGTITIRPNRKGATDDEKFSFLKKDINVTAPGAQKANLDTVKVGQTVQLTIGTNGDVEAVAIQALAYIATVADVDAGKRTIKIGEDEKQTTTLPVAGDAKIWIAGRSVFLREVKPGSEMTVNASLDGKTVLGLNLVSDPDGKLANKLYPRVKISKLPGLRIVGTLSDIDAGKNELSVIGPKTKNVPRRMAVAKDAVLQLIYGQVALQDLQLKEIGKNARATVLAADDKVTYAFLDPPTERVRVKAIDGERGVLTVASAGSNKTFDLRRGIKVMNGTRVMRLGDLQADLAVNLVLSLDRQQLLAVDIRQLD